MESGGGEVIAGSCTAYRAELCNGCDDDGDTQVDENATNNGPLTNGSCQSGDTCPGTSTCTSGAFQCIYQAGARVSCWSPFEDRCYGATAACRADGSRGACQPPVPGLEDCNGCDDDYDGVVDNLSGQAGGSLTRECQSGAGVCPGTSQSCRTEMAGGYTVRYWGACTAPTEGCNGADDDCDGSIDEGDVCLPGSEVCACQPQSCVQQGKNCGTIDDGCGWPLECGTCAAGKTCGGDGTPNVCSGACTPLTQTQACQGKCGTVSNGCTGSYQCGGCTSPQTCGGGGTENVCGCTPTSQAVACAGKNCGTVPNGCGGTYICGPTGGTCTSPQTCGGGGTANVCGCTTIPEATACAGKSCGSVSNGCGGTYTCGSCSGHNSCGGGGTPYACGCTPAPAYEVCGERECGSVSNGCGGLRSCGTCPTGMTCKAGGMCQGNPGGG
ncbi:hypothetical protein ACN469_25025 [Corallococcus terminator]